VGLAQPGGEEHMLRGNRQNLHTRPNNPV
jgi:hypothetical protein